MWEEEERGMIKRERRGGIWHETERERREGREGKGKNGRR